jgi:hypothetical protein
MSNLILAIKQEYFQDQSLDIIDRLILSYVSHWEEKGRNCFTKDGLLAKLFNVTEESILTRLVILENRGYIEQVKGMGGRIIKIKSKEFKKTELDLDIFNIT